MRSSFRPKSLNPSSRQSRFSALNSSVYKRAIDAYANASLYRSVSLPQHVNPASASVTSTVCLAAPVPGPLLRLLRLLLRPRSLLDSSSENASSASMPVPFLRLLRLLLRPRLLRLLLRPRSLLDSSSENASSASMPVPFLRLLRLLLRPRLRPRLLLRLLRLFLRPRSLLDSSSSAVSNPVSPSDSTLLASLPRVAPNNVSLSKAKSA